MKQIVTCENSKRLGVPVVVNENDFEHCLSYNRADGTRVEMAMVHVPGIEPVFTTAIYPAESSSGPGNIPTPLAMVKFSLDELRVRLAFVEHLKEIGLLDRKD